MKVRIQFSDHELPMATLLVKVIKDTIPQLRADHKKGEKYHFVYLSSKERND